jgi:hypothetical protein
MYKNLTKYIGILLLSTLASNVYADARNYSIEVHKTTIEVETPDGFYESSYVDRYAFKRFVKLMPDDLLTHTLLLPKSGVDDNLRVIFLATPKKIVKYKVSDAIFNKIINNVKDERLKITRLRSDVDSHYKKISKSIKDDYDYDVDADVAMGEMTPLDVFIDNDDLFGFTTILNLEALVDGKLKVTPLINTFAMMNIKNKLVSIYIYAKYNSIKDTVWAEAKAKEFASLLMDKNK